MDAASALRDSRSRAKLTQRALAELTGVPQPAIARLESGRVVPLVDTLDRLLHACGQKLAVLPSESWIDRDLMRRLLKLTPEERLDRMVAEVNHLERIAKRGPKRRRNSKG